MPLQVDGTPPRGYKRLAKKVLDSIKKHRQYMGMDGWDIIVHFKSVDDDMTMEVKAEPEYYKMTMHIDLEALLQIDIDTYVRHEFVHAQLWLYTDMVEELLGKKQAKAAVALEERTVTDIERWPLWEMLYRKRK